VDQVVAESTDCQTSHVIFLLIVMTGLPAHLPFPVFGLSHAQVSAPSGQVAEPEAW